MEMKQIDIDKVQFTCSGTTTVKKGRLQAIAEYCYLGITQVVQSYTGYPTCYLTLLAANLSASIYPKHDDICYCNGLE